MEQVFIQLAEY